MAETYTVTREDLYRAACSKPEPCAAHRQTVDQIIKRLEKQNEA